MLIGLGDLRGNFSSGWRLAGLYRCSVSAAAYRPRSGCASVQFGRADPGGGTRRCFGDGGAAMKDQMLLVFGVLAGAVALFAWGRPRSDVVAILVVLALMVSRVLTPQEALAGFCGPGGIPIARGFTVRAGGGD